MPLLARSRSDHFWPRPLLARTTFLIKPFCAQTFANLTRKPWPLGLLFGICSSCLSLGHGPPGVPPNTSLQDPPPQDPPVRDPPLCCVVCHCCCVALRCVVVWCVGAVCDRDFRGCVQDLGAPTDPLPPPPDPSSPLRRTLPPPSAGPPPPPPDHPPPDHPPPDLRGTSQNFALFFHRPPQFSFFLPLLRGPFVEFWWCF